MWRLVCCAMQGSGHKKSGVPCQDKTFRLNKNNVHVIALSDGAGSARLSHFGAERVVRAAAELVADRFAQYQECEDAEAVRQEILSVRGMNSPKKPKSIAAKCTISPARCCWQL